MSFFRPSASRRDTKDSLTLPPPESGPSAGLPRSVSSTTGTAVGQMMSPIERLAMVTAPAFPSSPPSSSASPSPSSSPAPEPFRPPRSPRALKSMHLEPQAAAAHLSGSASPVHGSPSAPAKKPKISRVRSLMLSSSSAKKLLLSEKEAQEALLSPSASSSVVETLLGDSLIVAHSCTFEDKELDSPTPLEGNISLHAANICFSSPGLPIPKLLPYTSVRYLALSLAEDDSSVATSLELVLERQPDLPSSASAKRKKGPSAPVHERYILTPLPSNTISFLLERWPADTASFVPNMSASSSLPLLPSTPPLIHLLANRHYRTLNESNNNNSNNSNNSNNNNNNNSSSSSSHVGEPTSIQVSDLLSQWLNLLLEQLQKPTAAVVFPSPSVECPLESFTCVLSSDLKDSTTQMGCLYIFSQYLCFVPKFLSRNERRTTMPFFPFVVDVQKVSALTHSSVKVVTRLDQAAQPVTYSFTGFFLGMADLAFDLLVFHWKNQHKIGSSQGAAPPSDTSSSAGAMVAAMLANPSALPAEVSAAQQQQEEQRGRSFLDGLSAHLAEDEAIQLTDMYGFQLTPAEHKLYLECMPKYLQQVQVQKKKWAKFRSKTTIEVDMKHSNKQLRALVRGGIPYEIRGDIWWVLSGAKDKAATVLTGAKSADAGSCLTYSQLTTIRTPHLRDIEKDIKRTFSGHPFFRNQDNQQKLRRVLIAFSNYCPAVGYCQSLNFIAGMLLLFLSEEKAFWVMTTIISGDQARYYEKSMFGLLLDQKVLDYIAARKIPAVYSHLQNSGAPLPMLTTPWFLCMFLTSFPTETSLRILDCYFIDGPAILQLVTLSFLKLTASEILQFRDFSDITIYFKEKPRTFFDFQLLLSTAFELNGTFDETALKALREKFRREIDDQVLSRSLDELCMKTDLPMNSIQYIYALYQDARRLCPGISLEQFKTTASQQCSESDVERFQNIFYLFDTDHDGYIDFIAAAKAIHVLEKDIQLRLKHQVKSQDQN